MARAKKAPTNAPQQTTTDQIEHTDQQNANEASQGPIDFHQEVTIHPKVEPPSQLELSPTETTQSESNSSPKKTSRSKADRQAQLTMKAPKDWLKMVENIRLVRKKYPAPVDTMGCEQAHNSLDKDINQRFHVLVSLMLSSQTKDPITWGAVQKLKQNGLGNVEAILSASEKDIEDLIHPVGFYRRKAVYLKKTAAILKEYYKSDIPNTLEGLCALPGVGPKMAHLCMQEAWNVNSGIGVDTHVHRISARLDWVPKKDIKTPEDTRMALESWMPPEYWREINHLLVGFGQTICTPVGPKCNLCANNEICPSASIGRSKAKSRASTSTTATTTATDSAATTVTETSGKPATKRKRRATVQNESTVKIEPEPILEAEIEPTLLSEPTKPEPTVKIEPTVKMETYEVPDTIQETKPVIKRSRLHQTPARRPSTRSQSLIKAS